MNLVFIGSWLFLIGSAIFTFEAILEIIESTSILSVFHFIACLFFTIGSYLFLDNAKTQQFLVKKTINYFVSITRKL